MRTYIPRRAVDDAMAEANAADPREEMMDRLRALIQAADPDAVEERKWRMPSKPEGVPVWSHDGIVCIGEPLKNRVRLTFPKGASLKDPKRLFNTRLDSRTVRAIDFPERSAVNEGALKELIRAAVTLNERAATKKRK